MKRFIDFHAHHPTLEGERVIQDGVDTCGRHPWKLIHNPLKEEDDEHPPLEMEGREKFLAIGESGLDRLCSTPYDLQLNVFREEVKLSEQLRKPLFLHCVRAIDDVLAIRKEFRARQPWIWHGYRGGACQLKQLLPYDFYFSFGYHHNVETLRACPLDRMLLETDDNTHISIAQLYKRVAQTLGLPLEKLTEQMQQNFDVLFPNNLSR